jgi:hypothetical protein
MEVAFMRSAIVLVSFAALVLGACGGGSSAVGTAPATAAPSAPRGEPLVLRTAW